MESTPTPQQNSQKQEPASGNAPRGRNNRKGPRGGQGG